MKKNLPRVIIIAVVITALFVILNINVTTKQQVNYRVSVLKIPLYLKILDFFDRHYHYGLLVNRIIQKTDNQEERAMKLFAWTYKNIRDLPVGFPIVDDHVWHIIVRGYGSSDQFNDVFSTLCNYAGLDAFFSFIYSPDKSKKIPLSFVRIDKKWFVFDPYRGVYFKDKNGKIADLEAMKAGEWSIAEIEGEIPKLPDYTVYVPNFPQIKEISLKRASIQSPLRRLLFEFKKPHN